MKKVKYKLRGSPVIEEGYVLYTEDVKIGVGLIYIPPQSKDECGTIEIGCETDKYWTKAPLRNAYVNTTKKDLKRLMKSLEKIYNLP